MKYRPYQSNQFQKVKARLAAGVKRQLVVAATGTGKTVFMSNLGEEIELPPEKRIIVLLHRFELAKQTKEKFEKWNPTYSVGIEMGDNWIDGHEKVVIASNATIGREGQRFEGFLKKVPPSEVGLFLIDEAHHSIAESYKKVLRAYGIIGDENTPPNPDAPLLVGVTATPNRGDGQAMAQVYDEIVDNYGMVQAIEDGWLAEPLGIKIDTLTDLSKVKTRLGDFAEGELAKQVNNPLRNKAIVQSWVQHAYPRKTVAFCVDVQHAKDLAFEFQKAGIPAEHVSGEDPAEERARKLKDHREGRLMVLTNCQILTEGYDDWTIQCIIMARPTKSQALYVQAAGRGTRIPDGVENLVTARQAGVKLEKENCLVLDVVDVTGKHSLVTLPSILGLSSKMNLRGKSAVKVAKEVQELTAKHQNIDIEKILDADQIKTIASNVSLFEMKWDPVILDNSSLAWMKRPDGTYTLQGPNVSIDMWSDDLDKWHVKGRINSEQIQNDGSDDIQSAILYAEMNLMLYGREVMNALKREAPAKKKPREAATPKQVAALVRYCKMKKEDAEKLSKGEAGLKLSQRARNWAMFRRK